MSLQPDDEANQELAALVAPDDWEQPVPDGPYNLVAIGGGTAGLVAAIGAAGLGARAALIEGGMMGGDCLNWGCVPSKAVLRSARVAADARRADALGVRTGEVEVDFGAVMARMRRLRADIAHHDSFERVRGEGVDTFRGRARFTSPDTVRVGDHTLRFSRAVICTGAVPVVPPIPGLDEVGPLTNETIFQLTELPGRLLVVGAGPIGCELAQAFRRFGSTVTLIDVADRVLPRDDPDAAALVAAALEADGVVVRAGTGAEAFRREGGEAVATLSDGTEVRADAVLVAVGRRANVEGLGLEVAGVKYDADGVQVDDFGQTSNSRVYAAGDVTGRWQFTHTADAMSRVVLRNALFFGRQRLSELVVPWATYTDPEVAHVGLTAEQAEEAGATCTRIGLDTVDRAILDGQTEGFAKVYALPSGRVVGGTAVGAHAGDWIGELSLAITAGLSMQHLAQAIHPYPTAAEIWKKAGDAWNRTRLTPFRRGALETLLSWRR